MQDPCLFRPIDPRQSSDLHHGGFTAIELMVVISIVAILAAMALPSFNGIIERYRVRTAIEDLSASIYLGRSEAIRRGGHVTLAKVSAAGCTSTGDSDWSCGWVLFVDANEDGVLDAGEQQLQAPKVPKGVRISRRASPSAYMEFSRWGDAGSFGSSYALYPGKSTSSLKPSAAALLCISIGGRLRVIEGTTEC